jgi:hypothetical protein
MTRDQAVQSLVRLNQPLPLLEAVLRSMPWDWEGPPLAVLDGSAVASILRRHAAGELSDEQVVQWANLVEVRGDVESTAEAADAVFYLANPAINGPLAEVAPMLLSRL